MPDFSKHYFYVAGNARLEFEGVHERIETFVSNRLSNFGLRHEICVDWVALESRVDALLNTAPDDVDYIVISDVMSPFCDMELVAKMTEVAERTNAAFVLCNGAVPGTEVRAVLSISSWRNSWRSFSIAGLRDGPLVRWETQTRFNNQLNLYKYKRVKLFLRLTEAFHDLHKMSVPELMEFLSNDNAFSLLSRFGEDVRQIEYSNCPHCMGKLHSLANSMSQPLCGYLPSDRPVYHECESCGLVILSPAVHEDEVHQIYDKWDKQDFVASTNNPYTSESVRCDFSKFISHLPKKCRSLDLGGGIGNFSRFLSATYPEWEVTHSDFEIKANAPVGVKSRTLDFTRNPIGYAKYDLITAWEVIEHVPYHKIEYMLCNIWDALEPGGFFLFSTPDFDSPLTKSFDFFAICPPFHYTVLGQRWLQKYFAEFGKFDVFDVRHCSDFIDDALNWYDYGGKNCPSMALRGTAQLLHAIFESDSDHRIRNHINLSGMGTEIVMTLRKPTE